EAFNVGRGIDNVQVRDIAELVRDAVAESKLSFADGAGPDLRSYRVDFSKLESTFPALHLSWNVQAGVEELIAEYKAKGFSYADFESSRYVRLRRISELLSRGLVDPMLRCQTAGWLPGPGTSPEDAPVQAPVG